MKYKRLNIKSLTSIASLLLVLIYSTAGADTPPAFPRVSPTSCGLAESVTDMVYVLRGDKRLQLTEGFELRIFDTVWTGTTGSATLRLIDNTEIELGPDSTSHLVDVIFRADKARLQLHIDKGNVRVRTGAIGLKNPRGIRIVTPRNLFMPSNCVISFIEQPEEEVVQVEWMPEGPTVTVYNPASEGFAEIAEPGTLLVTKRNGEMYIGNVEKQ